MSARSSQYPDRPAETSVPIHDLLAVRWSPRRIHEHEEVSPEQILTLLEAARWAPSSGNEQPWRFLVLSRKDPRREALESTLKPGNVWAKRAPVLIATFAKQTRAKRNEPNRWAEHDTGVASAFLIAQAVAMGLVAHPMGGFDADALARALDAPAEYTPMTVIAVGRYDAELRDRALEEREDRPRTRKALAEIAFGGAFGESLSTTCETPADVQRTSD